MDKEIIDFLYLYSENRKNKGEYGYKLTIDEIDIAIEIVGVDKYLLTKWLNENT